MPAGAAHVAGFRLGLSTGSPTDTITYIIDLLYLRRHFDVMVGKDSVDKGSFTPTPSQR